MEPKTLVKRLSATLLATTMAASSFSPFTTSVLAQEAKANELPIGQFATDEELKLFNTIQNDDIPAAKVYFGDNNQQWWITGSQQEQGLTLFAASPLATNQVFEPEMGKTKEYDPSWNCTYVVGTAPTEVYANHYAASPLRKMILGLETSYFTSAEQALMNKTKSYINDLNGIYFVEDKLQLAFGNTDWTNFVDCNHITVGEIENKPDIDLNSGLRIDLDYWTVEDFWLRGPGSSGYIVKATNLPNWDSGAPDHKIVGEYACTYALAVVPAFEFNLSSVLFGSATPAASKGDLTLQDTDGDGAFTLRFDASKHNRNLGAARVSYDKNKVKLTNVPSGTYLVVQNSTGAKAKQITNEVEVAASDLELNSFENCKVWLETTDAMDRMTYATLAKESLGYNINVIGDQSLKIVNGTQEVTPNSAITEITVEVAEGYYLPSDYMSTLQKLTWNGLSLTQTEKGFNISGTPTDDVDIQLPSATPKPVSGGGGSTAGVNPVYRAYNPNNGEHLYTLDEKEYKHVTTVGWDAEGVAFMAEEEKNGQALYRVYNPNSGLHHYTLDENEKNTLVSLGWHDEKVAWYTSKKPQSAAVYRVYNSNDGNHHYTMSKQEKDTLVSLGWHDEGLAFRTAPIETK